MNTTYGRVNVSNDDALRTGTLSVSVDRPNTSVNVPVPMTDAGDHWMGVFQLSDDGQYDVTATATDLAGNQGTDSVRTRFATESTDANNTITMKMEPSGLFVEFTTGQPVNDTFVTMTESEAPLAPLARGDAGVNFLNAHLGAALDTNLTSARIGVPVDRSHLPSGTDVDDVTIRYYNETGDWEDVETSVENVTLADGTSDEYWTATVTHFSTYGAVVADSTPPTITGTSPADGHQFAAGTTSATLRVDFTDAISGVDTSQTAVLFNDVLVSGDAATTITSGYVEYDATGLTDGTSHEFTVTVEDTAGNQVTETFSFSVASPTNGVSQPGGSSGTGSGTASEESQLTVVVERLTTRGVDATVKNGLAGTPSEVAFPEGVLAEGSVVFDRLVVTPAVDRDLVLRISTASDASNPLEATAGTVLAYLNVSHPTVPDQDLEGVTFRFVIDRDTLATQDATSTDVDLYRYHDGSWTELETVIVETQEATVVFEADSPGFSIFAVAASNQQPTTTVEPTTVQPTTAGEQSTTQTAGEVTGTPTTSDRTGTTTTSEGMRKTTSTGADLGLWPLIMALLLLLFAAAGYNRQRD